MTRRDLAAPASRRLWDEIGDSLFSADFVTGNLEFPINPHTQHYRILRYSVREEFAEPFISLPPKGGFDYFSLGNNHINDSYAEGVRNTMEYLDAHSILHSGCSAVEEDIDTFPIVDINGISVALLSYTFTTNGVELEDDFTYGVNLVRFNALDDADYDPSLIHRHIEKARQDGADLIVCNIHWGIEFEYYPSKRLVSRAHDLLEAGVDVIVGHHPHILNPAEWYTTKDGRNTLCCYSLGNLTSFALKRPTMKLSEIVKFSVEAGNASDGSRKIRLTGATIEPTFFCKHGFGKKADHRILPLFKTYEELDSRSDLTPWQKYQIRHVYAEYQQYFLQKDAFTYV
ncbi:poly-gamma-glutamate biosynthesis protein [Chitinivibrio alkaliphilus ACht1]|uniref:Poly-gamma-glutamate biosynthesis protein n=2 Tax=Chitinivibrio TaxID=1505231 RepID=U7D8U9_9BACT|nr:poly-gamma-glutamate biosynthesis protein [Chitinivibrio alkaliphilus ACht1]